MKQYLSRIASLCDQFVEWQLPDGNLSVESCPYLQPEYGPYMRYMELPFMARALYAAYGLTQNDAYKQAADKYCQKYIALVEEWITKERYAYKFGIAIESACLYARHNPMAFRDYMVHGNVIMSWMRQLRTDMGSYFLCGYEPGIPELRGKGLDVGFSDDLCHAGRGITRLYEATRDESIRQDIEGLADYFLTDLHDGTMDGIWLDTAGTWAIGPWPDTAFEHMDNTPANAAGWVWSAYGAVDFLTNAVAYIQDPAKRARILDKAVRSNHWIFNNCQFDDGAVGMTERDDKWVGLTAAAIMSVVGMAQKEQLTREQCDEFRPSVRKAWQWLLEHTGDAMPVAGYIEVTGHTEPRPGDNVAWLFSWVVECLMMGDAVDHYLKA